MQVCGIVFNDGMGINFNEGKNFKGSERGINFNGEKKF